jgi:hypothetical protein
MSLIKRPNSNNWYYLFQIQGRKYFGSTGTPKKTLAVKIKAKLREDAISRLVLGEVKPITLEKALERYKRSKEGTPSYKNIVSYGNKLLGFKLQPKTGQRIEVTPLALAEHISTISRTSISRHWLLPEKLRRPVIVRSTRATDITECDAPRA